MAALLGAGMLKSQGAFSYRWDWSSVWPYFVKTDVLTGQWAPNLLLQGLMTTLRLALWGMLIATLVGLIMGWMRNHTRLLLRMVNWMMLLQKLAKQQDLHLASNLIAHLILFAFEVCKYKKK